MIQTAKDKLILALDVETADRALVLFDLLKDSAAMFKIGMQLFTAAGPEIVRQIIKRSGRVFLDLKYHDIPNTVAAAGIEATRLGVSIFNIHASGGVEMMKRTAAAVAETAGRESLARPAVIAVTALTSLDSEALNQLGIQTEPRSLVKRLARAAFESGLDGVVASPQEIEIIRHEVEDPRFIVVTPGIRPRGARSDDQRRTTTPADAIRAGADYIVIGRPVLDAPDPVSSAREVMAEIDTVISSR